MPTILGIESTAHTFGVAVVRNGKVLSNCKRVFTTSEGGMIPLEVAKFHFENKNEIYFEALDKSGIKENDIDAVAFSQGPGLAPCLLEGMKFAKELAGRLSVAREFNKPANSRPRTANKFLTTAYHEIARHPRPPHPSKVKLKSNSLAGSYKNNLLIPIIPVNHCIAHLEIGRLTGARDPVMLYASGANTQIIAYASGKYRVFGETLDLGVGNFIDTIGRFAGLGFPAGPKIQELAKKSKNYIELPYKVKGMDIALAGIQTKLKQMIEKLNRDSNKKISADAQMNGLSSKTSLKNLTYKNNYHDNKSSTENRAERRFGVTNNRAKREKFKQKINYTLSDLAYSLQETVFAMLVETAERALAHTGKKELLLGGGVACNSLLQEMCRIMCRERGAKLFVPEMQFLVDNAGMIAYLGEIMFKAGIKEKNLNKTDIKPRERTDDVDVRWK